MCLFSYLILLLSPHICNLLTMAHTLPGPQTLGASLRSFSERKLVTYEKDMGQLMQSGLKGKQFPFLEIFCSILLTVMNHSLLPLFHEKFLERKTSLHCLTSHPTIPYDQSGFSFHNSTTAFQVSTELQ